MRAAIVTAPGQTQVVELPKPAVGPTDVLVKIRACGICGSDALYIALGGLPPRQGQMPLGHEPAGEVVEVGRDVTGVFVGDHVVINPMAAPSGITGNGGATGAVIVSHTVPFDDVAEGLRLATTPGAADKVMVTFSSGDV